MEFFGRIQDLFGRLALYPPHVVILELVLIWVVLYLIVRFVQGTRAAGALKGVLVILVTVMVTFGMVGWMLGGAHTFQRIGFLMDRFIALIALALIVIFQPELRRAAIRVGEAAFFRSTPSDIAHVVDAVSEACTYLSKAQFGAILVIERRVGLDGLVEGGTRLGAELSARLLQTIFYPSTPLHDLAVIIRGRIVHAASVQLPLAEPQEMPDPTLGSRHRAAVGLTKECDALVVVVSEESGKIRLAERGRLSPPMNSEQLRVELHARLSREPPIMKEATAAEGAEKEALERGPEAADANGVRHGKQKA